MREHLEKCSRAVIEGDAEKAMELAGTAIERGMPILEVIEEGFASGIREVGRLWEEGELFLPELVMGAEAMKKAMEVLQPELEKSSSTRGAAGKVVIGTIEGDIHDIGKTLVATLLSANGFEVKDLGADVPVARFVDEAGEIGADCIAVSALLTTTMPGQKRVIEELSKRSMRKDVKVLVGGAPCSGKWAEDIGADGYAGDAVSAVSLLRKLMGDG